MFNSQKLFHGLFKKFFAWVSTGEERWATKEEYHNTVYQELEEQELNTVTGKTRWVPHKIYNRFRVVHKSELV